MKKFFIKCITIQLVIVALFGTILYQSLPIDIKDAKQIEVVVQDVKCERAISEYQVTIYFNSTKYQFPNNGIFSESSNDDLLKKIDKGDKISIVFFERYRLTGKKNWIVDARSETATYRSLESYNAGKAVVRTITIIVFLIIEVLYILVSVFMFKLFNN